MRVFPSMKDAREFSPQYIDALAECITGGSAWSDAPSVGLYRSGPEIVKFFGSLGYNVTYGNWSRVPFTRELLMGISSKAKGFEEIVRITERLLDPRDYINCGDKLENVVSYLNNYLKYDGFEIVRIGAVYHLIEAGGTAPVAELFGDKATYLSLPNVKADFERAVSRMDPDPEGAVTGACSTLESVAKCILDALGEPYPKDQSIQPLILAVMRKLRLAPEQHSEAEVKRILGSLVNVAAGIGVLRTKYGDAHGRGKEYPDYCQAMHA